MPNYKSKTENKKFKDYNTKLMVNYIIYKNNI